MWIRSAGKWVLGTGGALAVVAFSRHVDDWTSSSNEINFHPLRTVHAAEKEFIPPDPIPVTKWDSNWDKRAPESLIKPKVLSSFTDLKEKQAALSKVTAKATRHIILIRHGQYNVEGTTDQARFLTPLGKEQSILTGKRLKEFGVAFNPLLSSTMIRAVETADEIAKEFSHELKRETDSMLEEGAPYPPDPPIDSWGALPHDFAVDGARIEAAFRKYVHRADPSQEKDSYELFICHGNLIRYFVCRALQLPPEGWLRFCVANCSLTHLVIRPSGRVLMHRFGDSGHLPPDLITYN